MAAAAAAAAEEDMYMCPEALLAVAPGCVFVPGITSVMWTPERGALTSVPAATCAPLTTGRWVHWEPRWREQHRLNG
ncbi:unnamed protein product [Boreogadus saida]